MDPEHVFASLVTRSSEMDQPRLLKYYREHIIPLMIKKFHYRNSLQVPKLDKIVVNMGIGEGAQDIKRIDSAVQELSLITGQRPMIARAHKSIANFKIKKGDPIGCRVTLRLYRMYEFLDRFISIALPRIRDFRGLSPSSFDGGGNYTFGVTEQIIFPEIEYDKVQHVQGMDITLVTTAINTEQARELLFLLGVPFRKSQEIN